MNWQITASSLKQAATTQTWDWSATESDEKSIKCS